MREPQRRIAVLAAAVAAGCLSFGLAAQAQQPPSPSLLLPEQPERSPLPEDRRLKPAPEFRLPAPPARTDDRLSSALKVSVKRFEFKGNTVFSDEELRSLLTWYEGRALGNIDIEEARNRITEHYIKNGYINSGAVLSDQLIEDGVLTFQIIEGRLTGVAITGRNHFSNSFLAKRISTDYDAPLKLPALQERLQLLAQNPLIERLNAELGPGERLGEAQLRVEVTEAPPYELGYRFSNTRSPSIGSYLHEARATARNLFGRGILLGLRTGYTRGLDEYGAALLVPLTAQDLTFSARYDKNRAIVIEEPFGSLDIVSRSNTLELGLAQPVYRKLDQEWTLGAYYSERETETFLLGQPFSFVPGVADSRSTVKAVRLSLDWFYRSESQVLSARVWFKHGLHVPGTTIRPNLPDALFLTRFAQFQWVRRLSDLGNQIIFRYDRQFTNGSLLASEKFALGGMESVRGYRENRLVKDQGWFSSLEYRHPVFRWVPFDISTRPEDGVIQLLAFADRGRAYDDREVVTAIDRLASVGVGVRWDVISGIYARFYYAKALDKINVRNADPQDRGLHFLLNLSKAF